MGNTSCIAVIPARSGSKRVPKKNIRLLCGKPIISYTIEAALESKIFSSVVVSTDSQEIADISRDHGAEVPFIRSENLADDFSPVSLVTLDAINQIDKDGNKFHCIAQVLPNCPLRDSADIVNSFSQFIESETESQISVTRYGWLNPWWAMTKDKNSILAPIFQEQTKKRSQDLPELFCPTGAIWWIKANVLRREKTFHCENRTGWEIAWSHAVDIDNEEDWKMAEVLMNQKLGNR
jgi:pseudaminic acid cytidylyltransferase